MPKSMKIRLTLQGSVSETCSGSTPWKLCIVTTLIPVLGTGLLEGKHKPLTGTCEACGR